MRKRKLARHRRRIRLGKFVRQFELARVHLRLRCCRRGRVEYIALVHDDGNHRKQSPVHRDVGPGTFAEHLEGGAKGLFRAYADASCLHRVYFIQDQVPHEARNDSACFVKLEAYLWAVAQPKRYQAGRYRGRNAVPHTSMDGAGLYEFG